MGRNLTTITATIPVPAAGLFQRSGDIGVFEIPLPIYKTVVHPHFAKAKIMDKLFYLWPS